MKFDYPNQLYVHKRKIAEKMSVRYFPRPISGTWHHNTTKIAQNTLLHVNVPFCNKMHCFSCLLTNLSQFFWKSQKLSNLHRTFTCILSYPFPYQGFFQTLTTGRGVFATPPPVFFCRFVFFGSIWATFSRDIFYFEPNFMSKFKILMSKLPKTAENRY